MAGQENPIVLKLHEAIVDYAGQLSSGRIAMFISLCFAIFSACTGYAFGIWMKDPVKLVQMLSFCTTSITLFLGSAATFYGSSKLTETFSKKWAPQIAQTVLKNAAPDTTSTVSDTSSIPPSDPEQQNG
jgi:hypothetical protein